MKPNLSPQEIPPLYGVPPRKFTTENLTLRAVAPGDSKLVFDLYAKDPTATRYMSFKRSETIEDVAAFIEPAAQFFLGQQSTVHEFVWIVELRSTGEPIGSVGMGPSKPFSLGGGYIFAEKWWGKGYASEAWKCVVDWAKAQPKVYRICAARAVGNPASGRVMEKAGMKLEGIHRRAAIYPNIADEPADECIYAWARE